MQAPQTFQKPLKPLFHFNPKMGYVPNDPKLQNQIFLPTKKDWCAGFGIPHKNIVAGKHAPNVRCL